MLTPQQLELQVRKLLELRYSQALSERPLIIWEPTPPHCVPRNLDPCLDAVALVDVFSLNPLELQSLFGDFQCAFNASRLEALAKRFVDRGVGPKEEGVVVVRAGEHGCLVGSRSIGSIWIPPFYDEEQVLDISAKVVDTTRAGNAGFAIGYLKTKKFVDGACYGSVAASFALEQIGAPILNCKEEGKEVWNDESVEERLKQFGERSRRQELRRQETT